MHCTNFLSGRVIWHMMDSSVHISVPTHIAACFCISLWCLRSSLSVFRWECIRMLRPSTGTTEWNHSYYTGNSLSALHSLQQLHEDTVSTSVQPLASTQETNGTASSGSVSSPQLPHSLIGSPVLAGPTRNITGEAMPSSLADAVTQLSYIEFLQRCNLLIAPPQPPQLPGPYFTPGRRCADRFTL